MKLSTPAFAHGTPIPPRFAFARPHPTERIELSSNVSPALDWADVPEGTRSFVLTCHDPDVPSRADDVNKPDRRIPADLPRIEFFHWVLLDIAADVRALPEGEGSTGITPRGKPGPEGRDGRRHGLNDFTAWFKGDKDMDGAYFGYDGPCSPFNDTILHHFWFTIYALDVARCPVEGTVDARQVLEAIRPHILAQATVMGTYSLAPDVG